MRILIAGDCPRQREALQRTLSEWGHEVLATCDGEEAWQALSHDTALQVALLDWDMPLASGPEVCRRIRERSSHEHTYVILLADESHEGGVVEGLRVGADDCLAKPFDPEELRARLQSGVRVLQLQKEAAARARRLETERAERQRAQEAQNSLLRRVEVAKREWQSTIDSLPQLVCLVNESGHVLRTNMTVETWGVASVKHVKGRHLHDLLHPGCETPECYLATLWPSARDTLGQGLPARFEVEDAVLKRNLHYQFTPIRLHGSAAKLDDVSFAVVVVEDISEQKRAMRAILQRDRLLAGAAIAGGYLVSETDLPTSINRALKVLGLAADVDRAYVFENHEDAQTGEHLTSLRFEWARESATAQTDNRSLQSLSYERTLPRWYEHLCANKPIAGLVKDFPESERHILEPQDVMSILAVPIWARRALWGHVGFADCHSEREWTTSERDILIAAANTVGNAIERRRAEEELRESEEKFRCITVAANDAIIMIDDLGKIVYWNQAAERVFGHPNSEALGKGLHELLVPECHRENAHKGLACFHSTGKGPIVGRTFETTGIRKDGTEIPVELSISAVALHERWHAIGVVRDISERKQAEEALARAHEREIEIGSKIQQTLLMGSVPEDVGRLEIATLSVPSQRIDGDFCDFHRNSDQCVDVIVGDVMGKGVPAALLGAGAKAHFLRAISQLMVRSPSAIVQPAEIVQRVHDSLCAELISLDSFVTVCYARIDLERMIVSFVDCGHTKTIHFHRDSGTCTTLEGRNVPFGFSPDEVYEQVVEPFGDDDTFLFYSDGVTEAKNASGECFGQERLAECVRQNAHLAPRGLIAQVRGAVLEFSQALGFTDDLTCVAVRVGQERAQALPQASLELTSSLDELQTVRRFVREFCENTMEPGLGEEGLAQLELAANEAAANIMKHAYQGRSDQPIHLRIEARADEVVLRLEHWGEAFDPEAHPRPRLDGSQDNGFGLHIIKTSVDDVVYTQDEHGKRCVELTKKRSSA